ncbi:MAG TPA: biosynthetic arginine decarboxylase [Gemmatimonadales bacterium]|nr:biosynthetic arginine decarboxylase [Gemmatimonadales bacterium]
MGLPRDRRSAITTTTTPEATADAGWTSKDSEKLYRMRRWGLGFFRINSKGHVTVNPSADGRRRGLDLFELAGDLRAQGIHLPLLLRFSDVLQARIEALGAAFANAIQEANYAGGYTTVYPIKVNQQRHVVQEVVEFGERYGVGLECGSKGELQAILGLSENTDHLIVCNGYKDAEFMRLALMGQRLGHRVFVVLEQLSELDTLLEAAEELGTAPQIGVRIKLAAEGAGRWAKSGGERSKFGLGAAQLVSLLDRLVAEGRQDLLKMIHFHLGSQITDIRQIKVGLQEIGRFYVELHRLGFAISHVDVGGGLGVDYDGTRSNRPTSTNYTLAEYANDVVHSLASICRQEKLPMPHVVSESGRAITAHHAILLVDVTDVESQESPDVPQLEPNAPTLLHEMVENLDLVASDRTMEVFHDAVFAKQRAQDLFASGVLSLRQRAQAEQLYLRTMNAVAGVMGEGRAAHPELGGHIESALVDRYFCNFSVFQSLPDSWAIDQVFPIMPIHRLDEEPTRRATLHDITCDSDGVIDLFVGGGEPQHSLLLHPLREDEPYVLGVFLVGAYQEILGDLHNLFGDTNAVHVRMTKAGYEITDMVHGDTVTEVLTFVQFHAADLLATFRRKVGRAADLTRAEANNFIADYVAGLEGYTYLEGEARRDP